MQVGTGPIVFNDLIASNPNCYRDAKGYLDCEIPIAAPNGKDSFKFALFDQLDGSGSLLARSTQSFTVTGGPQTINVAMHAVVSGVTLSTSTATVPLSRSAFASGQYTYVKLGVTATDADGNVITDTPSAIVNYDKPVTITDRETNGSQTGLVAVKSGATPAAGATPVKSVTLADPSSDVYAVYYGGFIRAVAFDATSSEVTNASNLVPTGFSTDCQQMFVPAQTSGGSMSTSKAARFMTLTSPVSRGRVHADDTKQPVFAGGGSIFYDSNFITGCNYSGDSFSCNLEPLVPGECVSMGMGFTDQSVPNDDEPLVWDENGASNLITTITPAQTTNAVPTCYELYAAPNSLNTGDIWQPNAGTPGASGTTNDRPIADVSESVVSPTRIDPSTYHDDLEDCVAGTVFPQV